MKQEEKDLLIKDLCARLPYGVKVKHEAQDFPSTLEWIDVYRMSAGIKADKLGVGGNWGSIEFIQPYLRPMSSMTEEEKEEYKKLQHYLNDTMLTISLLNNWLNEHHFDYCGLIEKGLALEAPKDMYKED